MMPDSERDAEVTKTQEDQEAAAACYDELTGAPGRTNPDEMQGDWLTAHFARHAEQARLAAKAECAAREEALEKALIAHNCGTPGCLCHDLCRAEDARAALNKGAAS